MKTVLTSGGFDPLHIGHLHLFKAARELGDRLIVIVNSDEWLNRKKGKVFMPEKERKELIESIRWVDEVDILYTDRDDVGEAILLYKPNIFAKGGDRDITNLPRMELDACKQVNCKIISGIGGDKIQSSSWLLNNWNETLSHRV